MQEKRQPGVHMSDWKMTLIQTTHLHDELVCTGDECQSVAVIERLRDVLTERVAGATR